MPKNGGTTQQYPEGMLDELRRRQAPRQQAPATGTATVPPAVIPPGGNAAFAQAVATAGAGQNGNGGAGAQATPATLILFEESDMATQVFQQYGTTHNLDSHRGRANALQTITPNSTAELSHTAPRAVAGLRTIIFWGHGSPTEFCGLAPATFADRLAQWKAANPSLTDVEMPTCDLQHYFKDAKKPERRTYIEALKPELKKRGLWTTLKIRTTPRSAHGRGNVMSKLQWSATTQTWAYITASSTKKQLDTGGDSAWNKVETGMKTDTGDGSDLTVRGGNLALPKKATVQTGHLRDLRTFLVPIN